MPSLSPSFKFQMPEILATSERVSWKVDDVLAGRKPDLTLPLLPEALAGVAGIKCLSEAEKLKLNQIRGHSYAYLFNFIEESIIAAVLDRVKGTRFGDENTMRALLRFADEEIKHQQLFRRYCEAFRQAFGSKLGILAERVTPEDIAVTLNKNAPLAVFITILHIEWVSQRHFAECFKDDQKKVDPLFSDLLRYHWVEEAQHTKVDVVLIEKLIEKASQQEVDGAIDAYLELGKAIDGLLYQQMELDVESLERAIGRKLEKADRDEVLVSQAMACRRALLGMGMTNPQFVKLLGELSPAGQKKVAQMAAALA